MKDEKWVFPQNANPFPAPSNQLVNGDCIKYKKVFWRQNENFTKNGVCIFLNVKMENYTNS